MKLFIFQIKLNAKSCGGGKIDLKGLVAFVGINVLLKKKKA